MSAGRWGDERGMASGSCSVIILAGELIASGIARRGNRETVESMFTLVLLFLTIHFVFTESLEDTIIRGKKHNRQISTVYVGLDNDSTRWV